METRRGLLLVLSATFFFGLNPVLAKLAYAGGLDAISALVYRFAMPALLLAPFLDWRSISTRPAALAVGVGAAMGLGMLCYFVALEELPLSVGALIYFTYPVFTVVYGALFFGQPVSPRSVVAIGLILAACLLVLSPSLGSAFPVVPVTLCFAAPAAFALLLHSLVTWLSALTPVTRAGLLICGHVLVLTPVLLVREPGQLIPHTGAGWVGALGLASLASLIPQLLMATGAPLVGAARTSILGAFELFTTVVVGWIVLGDEPTAVVLVGLVLICTALCLAAKPVGVT